MRPHVLYTEENEMIKHVKDEITSGLRERERAAKSTETWSCPGTDRDQLSSRIFSANSVNPFNKKTDIFTKKNLYEIDFSF